MLPFVQDTQVSLDTIVFLDDTPLMLKEDGTIMTNTAWIHQLTSTDKIPCLAFVVVVLSFGFFDEAQTNPSVNSDSFAVVVRVRRLDLTEGR